MTEVPYQLFYGSDKPGLAELRLALKELLDSANLEERLIEQKKLKSRVYRLKFQLDVTTRSLVVKLMNATVANKNELVANRWLPAVGLDECGPPLLRVAAERSGRLVWHIYEDLGNHTLVHGELDAQRLHAAVELISQLHVRFLDHPLLTQCRMYGGDLGGYFYASAIKDSTSSLHALLARANGLSPARASLLRRLLQRIEGLRAQQLERLRVLAEFGGPETMLHGDLWPANLFVVPTPQGPKARIIDWDHVAVGPVSYDLSNLLARLPRNQRKPAFDHYLKCLARQGWEFAPETEWNLLFETAEYARLATSLTWAAQGAFEDRPDWAYDELASVEQWFAAMEPALNSSVEHEVCL